MPFDYIGSKVEIEPLQTFKVQGLTTKTILLACAFTLIFTGTNAVFGQPGVELPEDIHPETGNRLAPLKRDELDAEGQRAYDLRSVDGVLPPRGTRHATVYSPYRFWGKCKTVKHTKGETMSRRRFLDKALIRRTVVTSGFRVATGSLAFGGLPSLAKETMSFP